MGTSDDEFDNYLNELNDIVDFSHGYISVCIGLKLPVRLLVQVSIVFG